MLKLLKRNTIFFLLVSHKKANKVGLDYFKILSQSSLMVHPDSPSSQVAETEGFKRQEHLGYLHRLSKKIKAKCKVIINQTSTKFSETWGQIGPLIIWMHMFWVGLLWKCLLGLVYPWKQSHSRITHNPSVLLVKLIAYWLLNAS